MKPSTDTIDTLSDRRLHNRRRFARAAVRWPVTILHKEQTLQGRVKNISRGGVLVYLSGELEVGNEVRIAVEIPEYQDAITAEGLVLRTAKLKNIVEKRYSVAASIQFTDISDENLKYFSGNLAPEWHPNYLETEIPSIAAEEQTVGAQKSRRSLIAAALALVLFGAGVLFYGLKPDDNPTHEFTSRLNELSSRLDEQEVLVSSLKREEAENTQHVDYVGKLQEADERIQALQAELATLTLRMNEHDDTQEKLQAAVNSAIVETEKIKTAKLSNATPGKIKKVSSPEQFYQVKKGENLYRISIKYNITIKELRRLNNLSEGDSIYPGQRLRIN